MLRNHYITPVLLIGAFLGLIHLAADVNAKPSWQSANQAIVDNHLLPRYERMATSTQKLSQQTERFCSAPGTETLGLLRQAYHQAMDDWMGIQHMRFGPVDMFLRYHRYQLWPDKHNTGAKQLRRLLSEEKLDTLKTEHFPQTSVAVQGFTALERLLYPTKLQLSEFGVPGDATYRCNLLVTISRNLSSMSFSILNEWRSEKTAYRNIILTAEQGNNLFESSSEVSSRLLNELHTQLQAIVDQKLLRPMQGFKLRRAESWRSRRSLRNIMINLKATEELYDIGFSQVVAGQPLDAEVRDAFRASISAIEAIRVPLYEIKKGSEEHNKLNLVLENNRKLKLLIATKLPQALGLSLGFNSLDGD